MNTSNPVHYPCDQILRWPTQRSKDWTHGFLNAAQSNPNILAIVAVGSAVRPMVPSVDLDLLAICKDPHLLKESPPIEVDLRTYSSMEIDHRVEARHDMLIWAIMFGKVLFQRDNFWDQIVESWHERLPLPSAKVALDRAQNVYRHLIAVLDVKDENAVHEQALSYLTHLARAKLLNKGVYPASRPELARQVRAIGEFQLAEWLDKLCLGEQAQLADIEKLMSVMNHPRDVIEAKRGNLLAV